MPNFFNNPKDTCSGTNMCSIDPSTYAIEELLLNEIKQIAFYAVKLKKFEPVKNEILAHTIRALSVMFINTALRFCDYRRLLLETEENKLALKTAYLNCCKTNRIKYEIIEEGEIKKPVTLSNCLKAGEKLVSLKQKTYSKELFGLGELITFFAKSTAINLEKLRAYGFSDPETDFEVLKFLNHTNYRDTSEKKLVRKVREFAPVSYTIIQILNSKIETRFGKRFEGEIPRELRQGHGILVSGSDLDELEKLLEALKESDINVYTNSSLYKAFQYPKFKEFPNLKAHIGEGNAETDFLNFKGPIFITKNFLQKIDYVRRGFIFTTKIISPEKSVKIKNGDFSKLIETANSLPAFNSDDIKQEAPVCFKYDKDKILTELNSAKGKVFAVFGSYNKEEVYKDMTKLPVIKVDSPIDTELASFIVENKAPEELEILFTHCSVTSINFLLSIISRKIGKIRLVKCQNAIINPHITTALAANFGVELV